MAFRFSGSTAGCTYDRLSRLDLVAARRLPTSNVWRLAIIANPYAVSQAEKEARKIGALLDCGDFDWMLYLNQSSITPELPQSVNHWVEKFEASYRDRISPTTWKTEYQRVFGQLDGSAALSVELLQDAILSKAPNSRQRLRFCVSLGKLSEFAGLDADFKQLKGRYSIQQVDPRDLPTDEQIIEWFHRIKNPAWQWVYGMIAASGLRNHEAFFLDTPQAGYPSIRAYTESVCAGF